MSAVHRLWYGSTRADRAARAVLAPATWAYGALTDARNAMYDRGILRAHHPVLPVLSLGNLSVGGAGKTPVAAWAATRLRAAGARPAVVMRGYGEDEPLVHARLNAGVLVVTDADRVRGVAHARDQGADCAILDDGFQHRRIRRNADWVLVAAEQWSDDLRRLPAGPLRETSASLSRASLLLVTRKSASLERAESVAEGLVRRVGGHVVAIVHLAPDALIDAHGSSRQPLRWLDGKRVLAVAAIGAPSAFFDQLRELGARVEEASFPDHHAFDASDITNLVRRAETVDGVVCTLKDAVKLTPRWAAGMPALWYVSQVAVVERGRAVLDASLEVILAARERGSPTAGLAGPSSPGHGHRPSTAD